MLDEFHDVVNTFFDELGWSGSVTLVKATQNYNDTTSENVVTEKRYTMQAIPIDYIKKNEGDGTKDQTLIRSGDKQLFLKPNKNVKEIDPSADKIIMAGKTYKIVTVKDFNPSLSSTLYYELYIRI